MVTMQKIESAAVTLFMAVLIALGIRVFFITLPRLDLEMTEAQNMSLIAIQNGAVLRQILTKERTDLPVTQGKANAVLDQAGKTLADTDMLIAHIDKSQDGISLETVNALKALEAGITTTANSATMIGYQTVVSEKAIARTADAATLTAQAATKTADATTDTAQATAKLVKDSSDPVLKSEQNIQKATVDFADATSEAKQYLHKMLHPKWPKVIYGEVKDFSAKVLGAWL